MSGRGGGGGGGGVSGIPGGSRKMVQSLKEVVNSSTEQEIYAMLKECNMDPNEAVNRLLAQDPFHEVKSKREKKKESKEPAESRSRGGNFSNYGGRGGDRYASRGGGSNHFGSNESGSLHGRTAYKKENGTPAYAGSLSTAAAASGYNSSRQPSSYSDSVGVENKVISPDVDEISTSSQPISGNKPTWGGKPGQISMADIVKKGRPQARAPPAHVVNRRDNGAPPAPVHNLNSSRTEPVADEWPLIEHPPGVSMSSILGKPANYELYANSSSMPVEKVEQPVTSQLNEVETEDDSSEEALNTTHDVPTSISGRDVQEDNSANAAAFDENLYEEIDPYHEQRHVVEDNEAGHDAATVAGHLQQLDLQKDDREELPEEENPPPVVIPNHLQLHTPDCLQLSFGSFRSGPEPDVSSSHPLKSDLEETSPAVDVSAVGHSDDRNPEYYGDEHLINPSDGSLVHRTETNGGDYSSPSVSQPEEMKQEIPETVQQDIQYTFPSAPGFGYDNPQQLNMAFSHAQSSQMQNNPQFASMMQAYTNSLPSTLLASNAQNTREDLPYSPFPVTQSMPTKYSNVPSSISGPTMSMPEALRAGGVSAAQPTQQTLPGAGVATGPALPQHLLHPYSQPSLPLGHFSNMIGYPFLPQSYTYMPSAYQQAFAGNNTYHQSLAAVLPQYKNSVSVSSLPQSANIPAGYGFDSSSSIPGGNYPLNPPTAPSGTTINYDDLLRSQYKDNNHLMSLQQQNDNSGMWVQGPGSRAMPAVPANNYYSYQGQNQQQQQHAGFRQTQQQQPSQQQFSGALNYPNFYHSQTGMSLDHQQQQSSRDASLGGSQGQQPSKQSQQLWQNSY